MAPPRGLEATTSLFTASRNTPWLLRLRPVRCPSRMRSGATCPFAFLANTARRGWLTQLIDRKSTRLNSSHITISYAVFCLKNKTKHIHSLVVGVLRSLHQLAIGHTVQSGLLALPLHREDQLLTVVAATATDGPLRSSTNHS